MDSCSTRREDEDPEFPEFYKCVDDSVLQQGKLAIPRRLYEHFWKVPQRCLLQTQDGIWPIDVKRVFKEFFFDKGWKEFLLGNQMKLGEYLVFRYTGLSKFSVTIFGRGHCCKRSNGRKSHGHLNDNNVISDSDSDSETLMDTNESQNSEQDSEIEWPRDFDCGEKVSKKSRPCNQVPISRSRNPSFTIVMRQCHVTKGPLLTPRRFMRNMKKPSNVKLQVANMSWNVEWIHLDHKSGRFSGGWLRFVKDNKLKKGDVCDFELISSTKSMVVMKIFITRTRVGT